MKKIMNRMMLLVLVGLVGFFATGCAQQPGLQYGLRGQPNSPYQRIEPLRLDPNTRYTKKDIEYVNWFNGVYIPQMIRNDQNAAEAAVRWTSPGYNNDYRQQQIPNAVSDGISGIIRRAFDSIDF